MAGDGMENGTSGDGARLVRCRDCAHAASAGAMRSCRLDGVTCPGDDSFSRASRRSPMPCAFCGGVPNVPDGGGRVTHDCPALGVRLVATVGTWDECMRSVVPATVLRVTRHAGTAHGEVR